MSGEETIEADPLAAGKKYARENAPGLLASALLHALGLFLILFFLMKTAAPPQNTAPVLPVDIVRLGDETAAPPAPQKSAVPQERAARIPVAQSASPNPPTGVSRAKIPPPDDEVEARLRGLAKLRQPDAPLLALDNVQDSNADTTSADAAPGDDVTYSVRDFIRAQVERRWSLNLDTLGKRNFVIRIRVEMMRNGAVAKAVIVDAQRFKKDAIYRDIAISARNAILLSSPFVLPPGHYRDGMDVTLDLNPRDILR